MFRLIFPTGIRNQHWQSTKSQGFKKRWFSASISTCICKAGNVSCFANPISVKLPPNFFFKLIAEWHHQKFIVMRKLILLLLLFPYLGIGQTKNVVSADRIFPKADKSAEFERALAGHAQKYHTGNWKWRVFEIVSGPDAGGFHVAEGPNSWAAIETRNDISTEHTADWNKNVAPYILDRGSTSYGTFNDELSTVQLTDYSNNIIINHIFLKPGMIDRYKEELKKFKSAWAAGNESIAVYESFASGPPQIMLVTRLKNGLKELEKDYRKPMKDRYNTLYGAGAYDTYSKLFADCVDNRWSEMLKLRPDLSSK